MSSNVLIFSNASLEIVQLKEWAESLEPLKTNLQTIWTSVGFELCVQRLNQKGQLQDHPPIDQIEDILKIIQENHMKFQSVYLPVDFTRTDRGIGEEISVIDGWSDLAAYMEIGTLHLSMECSYLENSEITEAFKTVIDYMNDIGVIPFLSVPVENQKNMASLGVEDIQSLNNELVFQNSHDAECYLKNASFYPDSIRLKNIKSVELETIHQHYLSFQDKMDGKAFDFVIDLR